jgi:hypothetical protein
LPPPPPPKKILPAPLELCCVGTGINQRYSSSSRFTLERNDVMMTSDVGPVMQK